MDLSALIALVPAQYLGYIPLAVTIASVFCAIVPTPDPATPWGKVYRVIEFVAVNFGKAKQIGRPDLAQEINPPSFVPKLALLLPLSMVLALGVSACAKGTGQDLAVNSYRTLSAAGITYDAAMKGLADAYDQGILDEAGKAQAIASANLFWAAYHSAVLALEEYVKLGANPDATTTAKVTTVIVDMIGKLDQLRAIANVIMPKLGLQGV